MLLCLAGPPCLTGEADREAQPKRCTAAEVAGRARCCRSGEAGRPSAAAATAKASAEGGLLPPPAAMLAPFVGPFTSDCGPPPIGAAVCAAACASGTRDAAVPSIQAGMPNPSSALPVLLPPLAGCSPDLPRTPLPLSRRQALAAAAAACSPDARSWRRRSAISALRSPCQRPGPLVWGGEASAAAASCSAARRPWSAAAR